MRYMLLIYSDEMAESQRTPGQNEAMMAEYGRFTQEVRQRGSFRNGDALQPTSTATTVRIQNGKTIATDGPFAPTTVQLGGFYILDCQHLDEAIELAAKIPAAKEGAVEIRPILGFG
ncbi:MAG: YciI family protein [Ardenticatenaceae bacterium]|nr:YciI family protein [Ardenticatenaceae bacterium]